MDRMEPIDCAVVRPVRRPDRGALTVADLYCGAGGTSTGLIQAVQAQGREVQLTAVNHWPRAVATHSANHPGARHLCASLDALNPRELFAEGALDLLWASPECTHHSNARGGRPVNDQSRATAWCVVRWAEALMPPVILVENVREFAHWGPIGTRGRPLKSRRGQVFRSWIGALEALGYKVEWRILRAADYGAPTTRERLFVQAVRGQRRPAWPEATHGKAAAPGLMPWRSAKEIIDWTLEGQSIFERARPLAPKTLKRIFAGLEKFGGPFLVSTLHKEDRPKPRTDQARVRQLSKPLPAVTGVREFGICQPYIVHLRGTKEAQVQNSGRPITDPLPTLTAGGGHLALIEPFLLGQQSGGAPRAVSQPVPTVATAGAIGLIQPYLVSYYSTGAAASVEEPLRTATTKPRFGLAQPEVVIDGERYRLDIRFRMLTPRELARAQGFPDAYNFTGNQAEIVKQIGNAVPCHLAAALVRAQLEAGNL